MRSTRRRRRFPLLILLLLLVSAATMSGIFPFRQMIAQRRAVDLAQEKLAALQAENARLEESIALLDTPEEVERLAREQFGYILPGEVAYVVVGSDEPAVAGPAPAGPLEASRTNWWEPIFDFLTGRDADP